MLRTLFAAYCILTFVRPNKTGFGVEEMAGAVVVN